MVLGELLTSMVILEVVSILIGYLLLYYFVRRKPPGTFVEWAYNLISIILLIIAVVTIGPVWGSIILVSLFLGTFLISGIQMAAEWEQIYTDIGLHTGLEKNRSKQLTKELRKSHKACKAAGLLSVSQIAQRLAERNRTPNEIKQILPHITMFMIAHQFKINKENIERVVDTIDRILRIFGYNASQAQRVVDVLTQVDLKSPASADELIEGFRNFLDREQSN